MNRALGRHIGIGIGFVLAQVLIFQHLTIWGSVPDLVLLFLLWIIPKYKRTSILFFAAGLGLLQDALFDFWGMHMFSKILLCFVSYRFIGSRGESRLLLWQIFLICFVCAAFHNLVFMGLSNFVDAYATGAFPILFLFGNSLYTAILGVLLFIYKGS
ncbi:MAG: rod shape-determining protein MreD [Bacteroidota bacterium]